MRPRLLLVDGYFMMHRARSGFNEGDFPVVYNFLRGLKALVDTHAPCVVAVVTEGAPVKRIAEHAEYKANRAVDPVQEPEKHAALVRFVGQRDLIIDLLPKMGVSVIRHPNFEADDVIANLARLFGTDHDVIIASGDSDFIQAIESNVRLYHPIKKEFVEPPAYRYIAWKALRGDPTDNIPGIPGIGDKKAAKIAALPDWADVYKAVDALRPIDGRPAREIFERNYELIRFHPVMGDTHPSFEHYVSFPDWDALEGIVRDQLKFASFFKGDYWAKFRQTFDNARFAALEPHALDTGTGQ